MLSTPINTPRRGVLECEDSRARGCVRVLMRRIVCALLVVITMTMGQSPEIFLSDFNESKSSESQLNIVFSNGPDENQDVKGLYTLSFASTGSGTISSIEVEISSDGSNWASIANLTSTPWLKHVDTTQYQNGTYTFRARAWDSYIDINNHYPRQWFSPQMGPKWPPNKYKIGTQRIQVP